MLNHECQQRLAKDIKTCNDEKCSDSQITNSKYQDYSQAPIKEEQQCSILKKVPRHTRSSKFPFTLHQMLELVDKHPEEYYIEGVGSFRPRDVLHLEHHGRAFVIVDKNKVAKYFLPKFFPFQTEYSSFQRQLNLYGFTRLMGQNMQSPGKYYHVNGQNIQIPGKYYHEMFLRTRPDLCRWIVRSKKPADEIRQLIDPASHPDFELFPPLTALSGREVDALQQSTNSCVLSDGSIQLLISKSMAETKHGAVRNLTPKQNAATIVMKRTKEAKNFAQKNQSQYQESEKQLNNGNIGMSGNHDSKKSSISSLKRKQNHLISTPSVCLSEPRLDQNLDRKINFVNEENDLRKGRQMKQRIFEPKNRYASCTEQKLIQEQLFDEQQQLMERLSQQRILQEQLVQSFLQKQQQKQNAAHYTNNRNDQIKEQRQQHIMIDSQQVEQIVSMNNNVDVNHSQLIQLPSSIIGEQKQFIETLSQQQCISQQQQQLEEHLLFRQKQQVSEQQQKQHPIIDSQQQQQQQQMISMNSVNESSSFNSNSNNNINHNPQILQLHLLPSSSIIEQQQIQEQLIDEQKRQLMETICRQLILQRQVEVQILQEQQTPNYDNRNDMIQKLEHYRFNNNTVMLQQQVQQQAQQQQQCPIIIIVPPPPP